MRPPWSVAEERFTEDCNRCGDCIKACPERILEKGRGGFPWVNFGKGECTFCENCLEACPTRALRRTADEDGEPNLPWEATITLESHCLAFNGVECRVCGEQCESEAIRYRLVVGGNAMPELDQQACTGCGACYRPCPVNAVTVTVTPIIPMLLPSLKKAGGENDDLQHGGSCASRAGRRGPPSD